MEPLTQRMPARFPPRINARGDVHCRACHRYLPGYCFREVAYPSLGGRPRSWSYCLPCTRQIDRERWTGARRAKENASRLVRQRRHQAAARMERSGTVRGAIRTLRLRGLTKTAIARLSRTSLPSVLTWERGGRVPTTAVVSRFLVVLRETAYLDRGDKLAYRRRLPHPDFDDLLWSCRTVERFRVKNTWPARRRKREAA